MNDLGAEYWDRLQHEVLLELLQVAASIRDKATEGGRKFSEVKLSPEMMAAMMEVNMARPQMPPEGLV